MPPSCLFVVDVQTGFINRWTQDIPARVEALQARFDRLVATRFYNPEGSFYRRLIGWTRFAPGSDEIALATPANPG